MRLTLSSEPIITTVVAAVLVALVADTAAQVRRATAPRGTVVHGEEGSVAVGRRGVAVAGEEGAAAVGRRGAVAVGEEGAAAVGRYGGVVVGETYEDHNGWAVAAGVATGIAIGTMLARPPAAATTVVVSGTTYWSSGGAYYARVYSGGAVAYQVVPPPAGLVITTLPAGCMTTRVGSVVYRKCGSTYYQPYGGGYRVVVIR